MFILDETNEMVVKYRKMNSVERKLFLMEAMCTNHTGKMNSLFSISTSCLMNKWCEMRRKNGDMICAACFSARQQGYQHTLADKLVRNTVFLSNIELNDDDIPFIGNDMFRFESFGDLNNTIQYVNYYKMAKANKHAKCALWTKNPWIVQEAGLPKLDNLVLVYSSPYINKEAKLPDGFDKVFTVYDKSHKDSVEINCGARSCRTCGRCYKRDSDVYIREVKK